MKKFLLKIALVAIPFMGAVGIVSYLAVANELELLRTDLTCTPVERAAIVGDSRVEVYFDPEVNQWLKNCGQSATPFAISAKKAKLLVEQNPNLELLIIDIWHAPFLSSLNIPFGVSDRAAPYGIALLELIYRDDMPPISDDGYEIRFVNGVLLPGVKNLLGYGTGKSQIAGRYEQNNRQLKGSIWENIATYTNTPPREITETPTGGEVILEHLLEWLKTKNVNVVLTSTPIYGYYLEYYTPNAREYFLRRMNEISKKHNVPWYNWLSDYQDEIDLWADGTHLNTKGARRFSKEKGIILQRHLKSEQN